MTDSLKQHIGAQVQVARRRCEFTQEQVAEKIDRTVEAISNIERGKALPTIETLRRLSDALAVPLRDFFPEEVRRASKTQQRLKAEFRLREIGRQLSDDDLEIAVAQAEALLSRQVRRK